MPLAPLIAVLALAVLVFDGRPAFYVSERMKAVNRPFRLWKLRTMDAAASDGGATGGHKARQITRTGALLRALRLDELPQLINILKGDMSFVGPRPPLRRYTERFPALYHAVLASRPGVTGLATLAYHRHEARLLAGASSAAEADEIYSRRCVPSKARLDLLYKRRRTIWLDLDLILQTAGGVFSRR